MAPAAIVPAVLTEEELARSLAPLGEATMLPAAAYTSREVLAWELRLLFAGTWTCLGRRGDLFPCGATQRCVPAGDVSVLLTQTGGEVVALANTCRHRGHELLPDGATAGRDAVVCPYHAWAYRLDGTLRGAPGLADADGLDLVRLPAVTWHDWVFVNATGDAGPFADHVGAMAGLVAAYAPERLVRAARHDYTVAANWKVIVENYHECYHCPMIHPELCAVSPPASGDNYDLPGAWVGGAMDLREHAETMSLDGRSNGAFIDGVDRRRVLYLGLLPNLLVSAHPDYVMTHLLWPLAPGRTRVECSWYAPGGDASHAVEFWDRTNRQDWTACESVQRGLASPHFRPGPFTAREDAVHRWVTMIARAYRGS
ncbi:MAG TPA: SRPBCC family protein [Streptosporangiaceae bacterium]|jgi:Rieske 2Fe-2S family protein